MTSMPNGCSCRERGGSPLRSGSSILVRHVSVHDVADDGSAWIHTHGLVRFGRAEIEVYDVPHDLRDPVGAAMLDIAAYVISGATIKRGQTLGDPAAPVQVGQGTENPEHWGDTAVLELAGEDGFRSWPGG
jgi:hypothetical protein